MLGVMEPRDCSILLSLQNIRQTQSQTLVAGPTFLSHGWHSLVRPSSSHLTTASSSFAFSTVPNSPVATPKLPKPSTRSPGLSSESVAAGAASRGFLARSESGVAPGCDKGGWEALRSFGVALIVIWAIV